MCLRLDSAALVDKSVLVRPGWPGWDACSELQLLLTAGSVAAGHNSDGKFIARAQRIEYDCELVPRRVAIFIEKTKDGQILPVPNVVVRDVACGANHTVWPHCLTFSPPERPLSGRGICAPCQHLSPRGLAHLASSGLAFKQLAITSADSEGTGVLG